MELVYSPSLFTEEVVLQRCKEVPNHRDTPGTTQDSLSLSPAHVIHIRVVLWKAEDPTEKVH